jgi:hypothetical protein
MSDRAPFPVWLLERSIRTSWPRRREPTKRAQLRELARALRVLKRSPEFITEASARALLEQQRWTLARKRADENAEFWESPRGTDALFLTGDRFRVKLVASRSGKVWLFNTTPDGVLQPAPVWQGEVRHGQELITPRMRLEGRSGVDQLHVVLEPDPIQTSAYVWLREWLVIDKSASAAPAAADKGAAAPAAASSKDIRLDVQNTPTTTYLLNPIGRGLVTTVQISHR